MQRSADSKSWLACSVCPLDCEWYPEERLTKALIYMGRGLAVSTDGAGGDKLLGV